MKLISLYVLIFSVVAHALVTSPFDGRNYNICQDFRVKHVAKVLEVISSENMDHNLYVVEVNEPYFSWWNLVVDVKEHFKVGDRISLEMMHTTSDVPLMNPVIEEGFSHSLMNLDGLSYLGFLLQPVDTVQMISSHSVVDEGEVGPFTTYFMDLVFSSGKKMSLNVAGPVDLKTVARVGDRVLIANGFLIREHVYSPNPFGNKKVIQKHRTGPVSSEPVYKKPTYGQVLFNLTKGTRTNL